MTRLIPPPLEMMRSLIERRSVSSANPKLDQSNREVIDLLAGWLDDLGFRIEILPVGERKANLRATLGDADGAEGLVLAGHTDTVPYDEGRWSVDPFAGVVKDDALYGLGSADMKSFLALAVEAAQRLGDTPLRHPLTILATADEESSMSGARSLAEARRPFGRFCVIGEPTGLRPIRMHKGVMMEAIAVQGKAGHSSDPDFGANAIEGMQAILTELLEWRREMRQRYRDPNFTVPFPTLNLGSIHGGDNPNRICAHCALQIDLRPLPGMQVPRLRQDLRERLAKAMTSFPRLAWTHEPLFDGLPPFETPAEAVLVRACEDITGQPATAAAFGTEAPLLARLGMETVVLGPGHIEQAHQPDEYLPLGHIEPCLGTLARLIERFCLTPVDQASRPM
ncbi:MAG: acetylornithine deacetylase [Methylotetracoccus sp.]|nr:acetylornithine deacetylase [Methylotetracoccus sp.]